MHVIYYIIYNIYYIHLWAYLTNTHSPLTHTHGPQSTSGKLPKPNANFSGSKSRSTQQSSWQPGRVLLLHELVLFAFYLLPAGSVLP